MVKAVIGPVLPDVMRRVYVFYYGCQGAAPAGDGRAYSGDSDEGLFY
jgi:hypothetical protein